MKRTGPRRRFGLVLLLVLAGVASLVSATTIGASRGPQAADLPLRPFIHQDHVPVVWAKGSSPEKLRDCRGCHSFGESGTRDPQAVCLECHIVAPDNQNTFETVFKEGWETLDNYRDPEGLFRHHSHAALACRECHQPEDQFPSDPMPIRRGSAECTRCHGPNPDGQKIRFEVIEGAEVVVPDSARRLLLEELNQNPNMLPDRLGPFFHSEHLTSPDGTFGLAELVGEGSKTGRCTSCHEPVIEAGVDSLHATRFRADSCGACHIGRNGPLEFGATTETVRSLAALTFSHADHLSYERGNRDAARSSAKGYERIEREGCHACHQYDSAQRTFVVGGAASHEGCRECHTADAWKAAKHGDWQGWGCTDCHAFERPGQLASDRPVATVRRRRTERFLIESQVHPHVAGPVETELSASNCKECHRARVQELPSRLGERAFSHATHLPPNPEPSLCLPCHGTRVAKAASSVAIGEQVDGRQIAASDSQLGSLLGLTYDIRACAECHRGSLPVPVEIDDGEVVPQQVTDFSHAHHIGKNAPDGAQISCTTCHRPDQQSGGSVGTLAAALDCTLCHNHSSEAAGKNSGEASVAEISRCSSCHVGVIPAAGGSHDVQRARLASLTGSVGQYHPPDQDCSECHQAEWTRFTEADIVSGDHVFAKGGRYFDRNGELKREQHRGGFIRFGEGIDCNWCHWTEGIPGFDFESEDYRRRKGHVLESPAGDKRTYPGGGFRAQFGAR